MKRVIPWVVIGLMCLFTAPVFAQDILVWDKDHNKTFPDPEGAGAVDATYGVTKALDACGETYVTSMTLPTDLTPYNIIFIVMGTYC